MSQFHRISIDATLIRALMTGDSDAARRIYLALSGVVRTLALRVLHDPMLADEVTQDTFIDVIEKAPRLVHEEAFVPWVRRIAVNHCLGRLRSPWYRRRDAAIVIEAEDPHTTSRRVDMLRDLERAFAVLSPETRFIIWLHDVEGYTHTEIGDLLGRSKSFSKSQLARGYARLLEWSEELTQSSDRAHQLSVAELIDTSQGLERSWVARTHPDADRSVVHYALLYRIANVDSELNRLAMDGSADRANLQALWQQRVVLLQSLLEVERNERIRYVAL